MAQPILDLLDASTVIAQGAEAIVHRIPASSLTDEAKRLLQQSSRRLSQPSQPLSALPVIVKVRPVKKYRHSKIDEKMRKKRTKGEARVMMSVAAGAPGKPAVAGPSALRVPAVLLVADRDGLLVLEDVQKNEQCSPLVAVLDSIDAERAARIARQVGEAVAALHDLGVVHGDLTTSNMYLDESDHITLIDFGLAFKSTTVEDQAVDLYVLERALLSTHAAAEATNNRILESYYESRGEEVAKSVKSRLDIVRARGRKKVAFG
mmetsp:Transcript_10564/g.33470  ORF Transcript_10564/g.33470 Transcript_10564/m.33470 type:complete len:263 (-) Transcript_10564:398-1186(-)